MISALVEPLTYNQAHALEKYIMALVTKNYPPTISTAYCISDSEKIRILTSEFIETFLQNFDGILFNETDTASKIICCLNQLENDLNRIDIDLDLDGVHLLIDHLIPNYPLENMKVLMKPATSSQFSLWLDERSPTF